MKELIQQDSKTMKSHFLISIAGIAGTLARYFSIRAVNAVAPDSFYGTLSVNAVRGCCSVGRSPCWFHN